MVEAGRRSLELPLTKQLHVLRRARSLRDPVTSSTTKYVSPHFYDSPVRERETMNNVQEDPEIRHRELYPKHFERKAEGTSPNHRKREEEERPVALQNWQNEEASLFEGFDDFTKDTKNEGKTRGFLMESEGERECLKDMKSSGKYHSGGKLIVEKCRNDRVSRKGSCDEDSLYTRHFDSPEVHTSHQAFSILSADENSPHCIPTFGLYPHPSSARGEQRESRKEKIGSRTNYLAATQGGEEDCQSSIQDSYDGTAFSGDDEMDLFSFPRHRCGIPCYWNWNPRNKTSHTASCNMAKNISKGLANSFKRRGCSTLSIQKDSTLPGHESKRSSKLDFDTESVPLLTDGVDSSTGFSVEDGSEKCPSDYGDLTLHTFGKKKRQCRGRDKLELALASNTKDLTVYTAMHRNLSQKYRPRSFDELVGQNIVVQSLVNAVLKSKVAPVYLFQGPRGTGKTSTARIFAAALNCLSIEELRPCGFCRECTEFASGKSADVKEVDAADKKKLQKVKAILRSIAVAPSFSRFKIFIIDECHMLTSETWAALLKYLEEPPPQIVFIFVTSDPDKLPNSAVSRCQKYLFPKIKESEIVSRLQKLAFEENLDVESDAFELIAMKSEGSLRDAEMMLDQLSLLGQRITPQLVHDLTGIISEEKLLDLLEMALSANAASTVRRVRELLGSGIEPMALMSQLATLIMDILASSCKVDDAHQKGLFLHRQSLTDEVLEKLRRALRILSEAEKQLRTTNDKTTWLTAALLQFAPSKSMLSHSPSSSVIQSPMGNRMDKRLLFLDSHVRKKGEKQGQFDIPLEHFDVSRVRKPTLGNGNSNLKMLEFSQCNDVNKGTCVSEPCSSESSLNMRSSPDGPTEYGTRTSPKKVGTPEHSGETELVTTEINNLDELWRRTIGECHSRSLRNLLQSEGKLASVSLEKGIAVVQIEFYHRYHISRAEKSRKTIVNSLQQVLGCKVEVIFKLSKQRVDVKTECDLAQLQDFRGNDQGMSTSRACAETKEKMKSGTRNSKETEISNKKADDAGSWSYGGLKSPMSNSKAESLNMNAQGQNHSSKDLQSLDGRGLERFVSKERRKAFSQLAVIEERERIHGLNSKKGTNEKAAFQSPSRMSLQAKVKKLSFKRSHRSLRNDESGAMQDLECKYGPEDGRILCWNLSKPRGHKLREQKEERKKKSDILAWVAFCTRAKD
eukprot:TRINITY_DN20311_c0_g1_i1.p1 TRINITY_DN20311_c0_g1~~TRINITY_DN20311_c0_g1_i1.p1  ORF type:complete len:1191 (+),score=210.62 TRINITY_DN20311_c0_g1_i1:511-4083(+)